MPWLAILMVSFTGTAGAAAPVSAAASNAAASLSYDGSGSAITYSAVVDALDLFEEEQSTDKVIFVHPRQVTQLRKSSDFLSADQYQAGVMLTGEVGMIAGCRVVPSKKVPVLTEWYKLDSAGSVTVTTGNLAQISATLPTAKVGDKVTKSTTAVYSCPIVRLESGEANEDEVPALTIYRKRDVNVETERKPKIRTTEITADEFYVAVLSNEAKVVLARFKE